jgi:hypothetical protein
MMCVISAKAVPFVNLDFEKGDTTAGPIEPSGGGSFFGRMSFWLPGWQVQIGDGSPIQDGTVALNLGLGTPNAATLYDADFIYRIKLEGKLAYVATKPLTFDGKFRGSLLQLGDVPGDAKSLRYQCVGGPWEVRVDGMSLDLYDPDRDTAGLRLREVSVDVSSWAGREVELKFTQALGYDWNAIDSIRFSPEAVIPEPNKRGVVVVGASVLALLGVGWRGIKFGRR